MLILFKNDPERSSTVADTAWLVRVLGQLTSAYEHRSAYVTFYSNRLFNTTSWEETFIEYQNIMVIYFF